MLFKLLDRIITGKLKKELILSKNKYWFTEYNNSVQITTPAKKIKYINTDKGKRAYIDL